MPTVTTKLKELRNADVRFISLVDRAATRIPFRIMKRDKEDEMDLSKIFKSDKTSEKVEKQAEQPEVAAVVVRDYADPVREQAVKEAVQKAGFSVDRVKKADEVIIYEQSENQENLEVVRLSPDVVLTVKGLTVPKDGSFSDIAITNGFFSGLNGALDALYCKISDIISNSSDPKDSSDQVEQVLSDFSDYVKNLVDSLPANAFKADVAVREALETIKKREITMSEEVKKAEVVETTEKTALEAIRKSETWDALPEMVKASVLESLGETVTKDEGMAQGMQANGGSVTTEEDEEEKKKKAQKEEAVENIASKQEPEEAKKADPIETVLSQLQLIAQKLDNVVTEQENQKKIVDELAQKSETLSGKLNSTVIAAPRGGDAPKVTETVRKADNDPRTGCFDTAFLRRR